MKFDSKTLLEEIIRTHLFEQTNISDTNVARPGLGTLYIYGNIEDPPDVSQADATFFKKINQTLPKTNKLTKRPFIKIFTKSKGGGVDENSRITNAALTVLGRASNLINSYSADITKPKLADFSMIVSQPQIAKPLKKATDSEIATEYNPEDKLYYTFVLIKNTDINTSITPSYTVSGTKVYAESQISSLKPIVTINQTSADDAIDNKFITTIAQLNNIGTSGLEKIRNLQRLLYTWTEKVNPQLKTVDIIKDSYSNFVKLSWNTAESPNNWDGKKGGATDTYIKYLQIGFQKQGTKEQPTVDMLIKILSDEVTANTLSLNESKSLKILTEQEDEWVFDYNNIKDLKPINTDDDNTKNKTKTNTNTNTVKTKTSVSGTGILASKDFTVPEWWKKLAKLSRFCDIQEITSFWYANESNRITFRDASNSGYVEYNDYNFKVSDYKPERVLHNLIYKPDSTYKQLINSRNVTNGQDLGLKYPFPDNNKNDNINKAIILTDAQNLDLVYRAEIGAEISNLQQVQQITLTYYNEKNGKQERTFKISGDDEATAKEWVDALENYLGSQGIGDPETITDEKAEAWKNKNQALEFFGIYKAAVNGIQQVFNATAGKYTKYIGVWDDEELAWREVGQPALRKYIIPKIQELRSIMKNSGIKTLKTLASLAMTDICNDNWVGDVWSKPYAGPASDVLGAAGVKNYGSRADDDTGWIVCMAENYVMLVQAIWQPETGWEDLDWYWSYPLDDDTRTLWRAWSTSDNSWEFHFWTADGRSEYVSIDTDFDDNFHKSSQNSKQSSYDDVKTSDRE